MALKDKIKTVMRDPKTVTFHIISKAYNSLLDLTLNNQSNISEFPELKEIQLHTRKRNDISDHLVTLFSESLGVKPKLIVELGVRGGNGSTIAFERVAKLYNSTLVSVDIRACLRKSPYKNWFFVEKDDIKFAKEFKQWCSQHHIKPQIDILFIDTSHFFEHTVQEIECWFPFLSPGAKVFFHDTYLETFYKRKDGSIGFCYNNERGVIRAIEKYFGKTFDEKKDFVDIVNGWLIKHYAHCNGLTILEKVVI